MVLGLKVSYFMKRHIIIILLAVLTVPATFAQGTHVYTDPEKTFKEARDLFTDKQYALAYPLLDELQSQIPANQKSNCQYLYDDVQYYYIVCRLKLQLAVAAEEGQQYLNRINNEPRKELMSFHLARYYFLQSNYTAAIQLYEQAGNANLSNEEIADAKFEKAYCYFNAKNFDEAGKLFNEIHQLPGNKYYYPANYYYGFISYYKRAFADALSSFKLVADMDEYKAVVPYYIAEIYYFQDNKEEALTYGMAALQKGGLFYDKEMNQLLGQIYFEKKDFSKALPLLEYYVSNSNKVSKEDQYELSYCYYEAKSYTKAIEGLKLLSNEKDSLGQNSMYILGDCYLKTGQKASARNAFQFCAYNNSNPKQQEISLFNYAKLSYELGYQDIALTELKKFLDTYPGSVHVPESKEILVGLLANTNNFKEALSLYESFDKPSATMQKVYPKILYGRAVDYINDQQIYAADALLMKILQLPFSPVTLYAKFWKGEINYRNGDYDAAIPLLNAFLTANVLAQGEANATTAKYDLGYCYMKKDNYKLALSYFEPIGKGSSNAGNIEQDAFVRTADCYFMQKDFNKSLSLYETVINSAMPQSDYALFQKSLILGVKNTSQKIASLDNLCKLYPKSNLVPDAELEIANTYMAAENFNAAIPYLNKLQNTASGGGLKPTAYLKLGLCYYNLSNNKLALDNYQQLIQQFPQSPEADQALEIIKSIYIEEGKPNEYVDFIHKNGKNISVSEADSLTYTAAEIKYNDNQVTAAIAGFENYLMHYPSGSFALQANYFRAECYYKNKDWKNALVGYDYVNAKGANRFFDKATLTAASLCYFELKDYSGARKYFSSLHANAINADMQLEALRGLVRCFYQLQDYAQANESAIELLTKKGISTDDKSVAFLVLGKSQQLATNITDAIASFKSCSAINKSAWGAQARYEIAACYFTDANYKANLI